jgi:hypothetical protein
MGVGMARRLQRRLGGRGSTSSRAFKTAACVVLVATSLTVPAVAIAASPKGQGGNPPGGPGQVTANPVPVAPIYSDGQGAAATISATGGISLREAFTKPKPPKVKAELVDKRTESTSTYINPDGSYTVDVSPVRLHYKDPNGAWQVIDTTLVADSDGGYDLKTKANDVSLSLSDKNATTASPRIQAGQGREQSHADAYARGNAFADGNRHASAFRHGRAQCKRQPDSDPDANVHCHARGLPK